MQKLQVSLGHDVNKGALRIRRSLTGTNFPHFATNFASGTSATEKCIFFGTVTDDTTIRHHIRRNTSHKRTNYRSHRLAMRQLSPDAGYLGLAM